MKSKKKMTIKIEPTWVGLLPTLLTLYQHGDAKGSTYALSELRRLAAIADQAYAEEKRKRRA